MFKRAKIPLLAKVGGFFVPLPAVFKYNKQLCIQKNKIGHSDFILKTIAEKGGRMEKPDLAGLLDEKYGYTVEPHLQVEQLIVTEGMIKSQNAWLFLTKKGQEAAKRGFANHLRRQDWLDRVRENKDIVSMAAAGVLVGLMGILAAIALSKGWL